MNKRTALPVALLTLALVLFLVSCGTQVPPTATHAPIATYTPGPDPTAPPPYQAQPPRAPTAKPGKPGTYTVEYQVSPTPMNGKVSVTYSNAQGGTEQMDISFGSSGRTMAWSHTINATPGTFVYIAAQLNFTGSLRVQIRVNGTVWKESSSSGSYVIATASGILP